MRIGVLALQGAFAAHIRMFQSLNVEAVEVRSAEHLADIDGLVLPGGESTALSMLIESAGLRHPLSAAVDQRVPMFGTCAGMILLASEVGGRRPDQLSFSAIDIGVDRNGYGRQRESFEADLELSGSSTFRGVFIRAPRVTRVEPSVRVLASYRNEPVLLEQGSVLVASFHPELTDDPSIHQHFIQKHVQAAAAA